MGGATILLLSHQATSVSVATTDEDAFVFQGFLIFGAVHEGGKGRVALDEEACVEGDAETITQLGDAGFFVFAATVGEEDERDLVGLEVGEGFACSREGLGAADQDAVDAEKWVSNDRWRVEKESYSNANAKSGSLLESPLC